MKRLSWPRSTWIRAGMVAAVIVLHEMTRRHLAAVDVVGRAVSGDRGVLLIAALMFLARFALFVVVPGWLAGVAASSLLRRWSSSAGEPTAPET